MRASVLVLSSEPVGERMAGPAIRAAELARALAAEHDVTLAAPAPGPRRTTALKKATVVDRGSQATLSQDTWSASAGFTLLNAGFQDYEALVGACCSRTARLKPSPTR